MIKKFFAAVILTVLLTFAPNAYAYGKDYINYQAHVQGIGWLNPVGDGEVVGTVGEGRAMEALIINFPGGIKYRAHVQNIGWLDWSYAGEVTGTVGQNLRMEAVCIELVGRTAQYYDVYYRAHVQNGGWLGWAKNGEPAGTAGMSLRLEALQVYLVEKGERFRRDDKPSFYQHAVKVPTV